MEDNDQRPQGGLNEGEGNKTADKQYRQGATDFAKHFDEEAKQDSDHSGDEDGSAPRHKKSHHRRHAEPPTPQPGPHEFLQIQHCSASE